MSTNDTWTMPFSHACGTVCFLCDSSSKFGLYAVLVWNSFLTCDVEICWCLFQFLENLPSLEFMLFLHISNYQENLIFFNFPPGMSLFKENAILSDIQFIWQTQTKRCPTSWYLGVLWFYLSLRHVVFIKSLFVGGLLISLFMLIWMSKLFVQIFLYENCFQLFLL